MVSIQFKLSDCRCSALLGALSVLRKKGVNKTRLSMRAVCAGALGGKGGSVQKHEE